MEVAIALPSAGGSALETTATAAARPADLPRSPSGSHDRVVCATKCPRSAPLGSCGPFLSAFSLRFPSPRLPIYATALPPSSPPHSPSTARF
eukprot:6189578-Pleurochrysis_carterae.AAC.2